MEGSRKAFADARLADAHHSHQHDRAVDTAGKAFDLRQGEPDIVNVHCRRPYSWANRHASRGATVWDYQVTEFMRWHWLFLGLAAFIVLLLAYAWFDAGRVPLRPIVVDIAVPGGGA